jgi:hypothetical protein
MPIRANASWKKADYSVYGFIKDEKIYISFFAAEDQAMEVLTEIIKINNMQINELRKGIRNILGKGKNRGRCIIEITKLNSELLNSKRTIEKQMPSFPSIIKFSKKWQ